MKGKSLSVAQFLLAQLSGVMLVVAGAAVFWRGKARSTPAVEAPAVEPEIAEVELEVEVPRSWATTCTTTGPGARRHRRIITRKPPSRAPHRS